MSAVLQNWKFRNVQIRHHPGGAGVYQTGGPDVRHLRRAVRGVQFFCAARSLVLLLGHSRTYGAPAMPML